MFAFRLGLVEARVCYVHIICFALFILAVLFAALIATTPDRDPVVDDSVLSLAYLVGALGLPVCHSLQAVLTWRPERLVFDSTLVIVGNLFAWVAQVLHICF